MKKRFLAAALLLLLLCGCGCGGGAEDAALPVLVIGSDDYAPYSYLDSDGFAGFDVELAEEACRRLGYAPEFRRIAWEQKDALLQSGEIDCIWGCFTLTGRETLYCWAGPYAKSRQMVAVRTESGIKNLAGLAGRRVAVQMTGKPEELAEKLTETLLAMEAEGFTAALAEKYGLAAAEG